MGGRHKFSKIVRLSSYFKNLDREVHLNNIQELCHAMHETISVIKLRRLIMRETVAVYCDNEKKYINQACRRYAVLLKVEVEWTYIAAALYGLKSEERECNMKTPACYQTSNT